MIAIEFASMVLEVQISDFYLATSVQSDIQRIYLTGGTPSCCLDSCSERRMEIQVELVNPFRNISVDPRSLTLTLQRAASVAGVAVGLPFAGRGMRYDQNKPDRNKTKRAKGAAAGAKKWELLIFLAVIVAEIVFLFLWQQRLDNELVEAKKRTRDATTKIGRPKEGQNRVENWQRKSRYYCKSRSLSGSGLTKGRLLCLST